MVLTYRGRIVGSLEWGNWLKVLSRAWYVELFKNALHFISVLVILLWFVDSLGMLRFYYWVEFSSVTQSCLTLCNPMDCSTPGLPVHHQLPEFTQTRAHWVSGAIHPSHPLSSPSSPAFNLSRHQGIFQMSQLFTSGGQSIGVSASTSVLPMNIQDWFPLGWTGWISLQSKWLSRVFSNTTVPKHQVFSAQLSL